MDEMKEILTINSFVLKGCIKVRTVYFLSEKGSFTVAVDWIENDEPQFKMFKELSLCSVKNFNVFLLKHDSSWHSKISKWLEKPNLPLRLKHN